jgi:hypothetical protein
MTNPVPETTNAPSSPCTLEEVLYFVAKYYPFTSARYPGLQPDGETGGIVPGGVLDHCLMHLDKSTIGPLAGLVEGYHHTGVLPEAAREEVLTSLAKALVNISAIAATFKIDSRQLCQAVPAVMKI